MDSTLSSSLAINYLNRINLNHANEVIMQKPKKKSYPGLEKARAVKAKKLEEQKRGVATSTVKMTRKKRKAIEADKASQNSHDEILSVSFPMLAEPRTKMGSRKRRPNLEEVAKAIDVLARAGLL